MVEKEPHTKQPFVRVVGEGIDLTIDLTGEEDMTLARAAMDIAFDRFYAKQDKEPKGISVDYRGPT